MVQPAESRKGLNLALARRANFCSTTCWRVLRESKMRPVLMVIEQVGRHQSFEMPLIEDDHVVQQVASATSYPALGNTVLPRTAKWPCELARFPSPSQPKPPRRQTWRRGRIARICAAVGRPIVGCYDRMNRCKACVLKADGVFGRDRPFAVGVFRRVLPPASFRELFEARRAPVLASRHDVPLQLQCKWQRRPVPLGFP